MSTLRSCLFRLHLLSFPLCLLGGCAPSTSTSITPAVSARTSVSRTAPQTEEQKAISHVHTRPFYQQATTACQQKRYRDATIHDPNLPTEQTISQERLLRLTSGYLLSVWK